MVQLANYRHVFRRLNCCLAAIVLIALASCSSKMAADVSGKVTLDGKAIGPGDVVFTPTGHAATAATGTIERDGSYFLKTGRTPGLAIGKYQVSLSVREPPADFHPGDRPPPGKLLIPDKYELPSSSGLEFDIQPGGNTIDLKLKSE
jgi:hypothetical protein